MFLRLLLDFFCNIFFLVAKLSSSWQVMLNRVSLKSDYYKPHPPTPTPTTLQLEKHHKWSVDSWSIVRRVISGNLGQTGVAEWQGVVDDKRGSS